MSLRSVRLWMAGVLFMSLGLAVGNVMFCPLLVSAQEADPVTLTRKAKTKVAPLYPDMARRLNISGTVRFAVVVAPNGNLKSTKVLGGHPVLVNAAMDALRKWKFESAADESSGIIEFKFQPME